MVQLDSRFTLLLALCLTVAARPAVDGVPMVEHVATFKLPRAVHHGKVLRPHGNGLHRPRQRSEPYEIYATLTQIPGIQSTPDPVVSISLGSPTMHNDKRQQHITASYSKQSIPQVANQTPMSPDSAIVTAATVTPTLGLPFSSAATTSASHNAAITEASSDAASLEKAMMGLVQDAIPSTDSTKPSITSLSAVGGPGLAATRTPIPAVDRLAGAATVATATRSSMTATISIPASAAIATEIAEGVEHPRYNVTFYSGKSRQKRVDDSQRYPSVQFDSGKDQPKNDQKQLDNSEDDSKLKLDAETQLPFRKGDEKASNDGQH